MALLNVNFFAESLGLSTSMNVLLPQPTSAAQVGMAGAQARDNYPVLYLLHGWSDDETIWLRRTSVERYAAELGLVVVTPRVDLSYYQDTASGLNYWTFISEELPRLCKSWFPISGKREDSFVAGQSMGGYGALRLGLSLPEKYAAVAALSGVTDLDYPLNRVAGNGELNAKKIAAIFGKDFSANGNNRDLFQLASQLSTSGKSAPKLYQCCGTEDFLYQDNLRFRDHVRSLSLDLTYEESPGTHDWGYWDIMIQRVLKWLPVKR